MCASALELTSKHANPFPHCVMRAYADLGLDRRDHTCSAVFPVHASQDRSAARCRTVQVTYRGRQRHHSVYRSCRDHLAGQVRIALI